MRDNLFKRPDEGEFIEDSPVIHQSDLLPDIIKERHLSTNVVAIRFGTIANRPNRGGETRAFFATDENKLYIDNGSAWVSTTLA